MLRAQIKCMEIDMDNVSYQQIKDTAEKYATSIYKTAELILKMAENDPDNQYTLFEDDNTLGQNLRVIRVRFDVFIIQDSDDNLLYAGTAEQIVRALAENYLAITLEEPRYYQSSLEALNAWSRLTAE